MGRGDTSAVSFAYVAGDGPHLPLAQCTHASWRYVMIFVDGHCYRRRESRFPIRPNFAVVVAAVRGPSRVALACSLAPRTPDDSSRSLCSVPTCLSRLARDAGFGRD